MNISRYVGTLQQKKVFGQMKIYLNWNKIIIKSLPCFGELISNGESDEELGMGVDGM